jgi:predicted dehydrogenase
MNRRNFVSRLGQGMVGAVILTGALRAESAKPRLRIGQIGTGHAHAAGKMAVLKKSADFEVVGIVEPDERLRRAAEKNRAYDGVRWMTEAELLATPGLRAVAIETEVKDLLAVAGRCVAAGMHVHLDKPAGESLAGFQDLLAEAGRRGLTVQLGYMFRYNPGFELCFRAVREGWLGEIQSIEGSMGKLSAPPERSAIAPYKGGAMFELGCHLIDAVVFLLGKPSQVVPYGRQTSGHADTFLDNQLAVLEYPKTLVTLRSSVVEVGGSGRRHFVVSGETGTIELRPLEPVAARLILSQPRGGFQPGVHDVVLPNLPRYEADFVDFASVIRGETKFRWSPAHDLAVQETVLRASGLTL